MSRVHLAGEWASGQWTGDKAGAGVRRGGGKQVTRSAPTVLCTRRGRLASRP